MRLGGCQRWLAAAVVAWVAAGAGTFAYADTPADVGAWNVDPALDSAPFPLAPVPAAPDAKHRTYAIHAALLPTGKVLFFGRVPPDLGNGSEAYLWDPEKGYSAAAFTHVPPPLVDIDGDGTAEPAPVYCAGQSFLPDGRLLVTGGNLWRGSPPPAGFGSPAGTRLALTFDPWSETWARQPDMNGGRYYPSQTELADGRTIVLSGYGDQAPGGVLNPDLDVYSPGASGLDYAHAVTGDRVKHPGAVPGLYPRMFLMPDRRVLLAGPNKADAAILDPDLLSTTGERGSAWQPISALSGNRHAVMTVLLPGGPGGTGRVLAIGGWTENDELGVPLPVGARPALASSETIDGLATPPQWTAGPALNVGRDNANAVILPDASLAVVGGAAGQFVPDGPWAVNPDGVSEGAADAPLHRVELYDPDAGAFRLGPAQVEDRAYHSTALLLPDGRVFSAGDDMHPKLPDGSQSLSDTAEIYSPPYLFRGSRPVIDAAPAALRWGDEFRIASGSPDLEQAVLIAPGATTHAVDMSQRYVPLRVTAKHPGTGLDVVAPPSPGVAPPGYYMLWVLNADGVPSLARWLRIRADAPDQPPLGGEQPGPHGTATPAPAVPGTGGSARRRIQVAVAPRRTRAGRRTRFVIRARAGSAPLRGAQVRLGGSRARTGRRGRARLSVTFRHAAVHRVRVTTLGFLRGTGWITVSRARKQHRPR